LQKLSDPDPSHCPACSAEGIRRQLTAPAFRLAGSGWYETDFKKDGDKKRNLAGEGTDAPGNSETAKTEPSKTEPSKTESAKGESAKGDSAPIKPAPSEPKPAPAAAV
jgi:predicted nucleic acid-binding Zn ribbon protein